MATDVDDPTVDPRFGRVGRQRIRDTGPLTSKRMETVDEEFAARTKAFIRESVKQGRPFFAPVVRGEDDDRVVGHPPNDERAESLIGFGVAAAVEVGEGRRSLPSLGARDDRVVASEGVSDPAPHP